MSLFRAREPWEAAEGVLLQTAAGPPSTDSLLTSNTGEHRGR